MNRLTNNNTKSYIRVHAANYIPLYKQKVLFLSLNFYIKCCDIYVKVYYYTFKINQFIILIIAFCISVGSENHGDEILFLWKHTCFSLNASSTIILTDQSFVYYVFCIFISIYNAFSIEYSCDETVTFIPEESKINKLNMLWLLRLFQ